MNSAASSGDRPSTSCRRWLNTSSMPIKAAADTSAAITAFLNPGVLNNDRSSIGCVARRWRRMNSVRQSAPSTTATSMASKEGRRLPSSLTAYAMLINPIITCSEPSQSQRRSGFPGWSGINSTPTSNASSTIGTLIRNAEPHQKCSSNKPPTTGPNAAPPEATEAQIPNAIACSRSSVNVEPDQGQCGGHHHRCADRQEPPRADQYAGRRREGCDQRAQPKYTQPPDK